MEHKWHSVRISCDLSILSFLPNGMQMYVLWPEQPSEVMGESGDAVLVRLSNKIKGAPVSNIMEGQTSPELL